MPFAADTPGFSAPISDLPAPTNPLNIDVWGVEEEVVFEVEFEVVFEFDPIWSSGRWGAGFDPCDLTGVCAVCVGVC